jgi:hypothetical protein
MEVWMTYVPGRVLSSTVVAHGVSSSSGGKDYDALRGRSGESGVHAGTVPQNGHYTERGPEGL